MSDVKKFIEENPIDVIEKFGGIRPMASKLGVAATTVQGWKKRESIPDNRVDDIIKAANENEIMLASRPNIEDTIAQIKAKIEQSPDVDENNSQPDEELMEFPGVGDDEDSKPVSKETPAASSEIKPVRSEIAERLIRGGASIVYEPPVKSEPQAEEIKVDVEDVEVQPSASDEKPVPEVSDKDESEQKSEEDAEVAEEKAPEPEAIEPPAELPKAEPPLKEPANDIASNTSSKPVIQQVRGGWALPMILGASVMGLIAVFWPVREDVQVQKERLVQIESSLNDLKKDQSTFMTAIGDFLPEDAKAQLEEIRDQTGKIGAQVGELTRQGTEIAKSFIGEDNMAIIQSQISSLVSATQIDSVMARFAQMSGTDLGQEQLTRAYGQLQGITESLDGRTDLLEKALIVARENSTALGKTFEGVPNNDLKAAALLLGLTQFRSALNRDNTPFEEDLALIYNMVDENNIELRNALDHLSPQAESGVLTLGGLSDEFRSLAGDLAVSSLKGEDLNVSDQAGNRLSKVLNLNNKESAEKSSSKQITEIQKQIDAGDLTGAYSSLSSLSGPTSETVAPFMTKLRSVIAAQNVKGAIDGMLMTIRGEITGVKPLNLKNPNPSLVDKLAPKSLNNSFRNLNITPQE